MHDKIVCPSCGKEIELTKALTEQIRSKLESQITEDVAKKTEKAVLERLEKDKLDQQNKIEFLSKKLSESQAAELSLRKEKFELEEAKRNFELEKQRQIDQERQKIREQSMREFQESFHLKEMEKDKMIQDLKRALEDAQLKATQGSQQLQGEVQELSLEENLRDSYPTDEIEEVGKGIRGADIRQIVKTQKGTVCGTILWESKRTKAWSEDWVVKLKEDLRSEGANIPCIVTNIFPKNISGPIALYEGVWLCSPAVALNIAEMLRSKLIDVARERIVSKNKDSKAETLYSYLISHEFAQQVERIVEVYKETKDQIDTEKRAFEKIWKTREVQAQKLISGAANIYGYVQGVVGQTMPQIKGLDLLETGD